jgi:hypothetical protein
VSVELSFMVGPALAVAQPPPSRHGYLYAVGAGIVASGVALFLLNPPTRGTDEPARAPRRIPRREWLTSRLLAVLAVGTATTLVLGGTDVAVVAVLRAGGEVGWTGVVLAVWAVASLVGGFAYGAMSRPVSPLALMAALSLCTVPVGLAGQWWLLCLALIPPACSARPPWPPPPTRRAGSRRRTSAVRRWGCTDRRSPSASRSAPHWPAR